MPDPTAAERHRRHLVDDVLAWWTAHGPDEEHGGVLTCWDNRSATLVSTDKYTWSQGRWAWLTARVAAAAQRGVLGVDPEPFLEHSERTARFVREHALLPDGRVAFVTDRAGTPREPRPGSGLATSVFADLFAALGFAGLAQVRPEGGWGATAEDLLHRAAGTIAAGAVPADPYPVPEGHRAFAFPMILLGVGEQVHRATGSAESAALVRAAAGELAGHVGADHDVAEMPADDPRDRDGLVARHRTPGHTLEALWFAHHARDLIAGTGLDTPQVLAPIALRACETGWDAEHGGLLRYTDRDGGPPRGSRTGHPYEELVAGTWDTKLWWPHAEAMYTTTLLAAGTAGTAETGLAAWAERLETYTYATFPEGPGREWTQIRARDGSPDDRTVALPVKDPFHVARALLLLVEQAGTTAAPPITERNTS
ncbi:AGE family epimerase/isomerase [Pseudonocardia nematodicida]|uniref:AGE family epimerase/isomerase n=1 Tax=Pseudonocardia nematodicida TaxID=1206997 RepID=A0ABV1K7Q1_9PSEU